MIHLCVLYTVCNTNSFKVRLTSPVRLLTTYLVKPCCSNFVVLSLYPVCNTVHIVLDISKPFLLLTIFLPQQHKTSWSHPLQPVEEHRRHFDHVAPPPASLLPHHHPIPRQHREDRRLPQHRGGPTEQMVHESIHKAFHREEASSAPPPPAHASKPEKTPPQPHYTYCVDGKEVVVPPHASFYPPREKQSVIVQAEPSKAASPKQRVQGRASPYQSVHHFKPSYEHSAHMRGVPPVDIAKVRPHPISSAPHPDRPYYPSKGTPSSSSRATVSLVPNPMVQQASQQHIIKPSKVNSPPPAQVYAHPDIRQTSVTQSQGPPPAHSSSSNRGVPPSLLSHDPAPHPLVDRGAPIDIHPRASYPPSVPSPHHHTHRPLPPNQTVVTKQPTPPPAHITQVQPLNLGTRDDALSSAKRRTLTPTPQEVKKIKLDSSNIPPQPLLDKVSEPSALYSSDLTMITSMENRSVGSSSATVSVVNIPHADSPSSAPFNRPPSRPLSSPSSNNNPAQVTISTKPSTAASLPSASLEQRKTSSPAPQSASDSNTPPKATSRVHKIKKHWLERHESGVEPAPALANNSPNRSTNTPPIATASINGHPKSPAAGKSTESSGKTGNIKPTRNLPNGRYSAQDLKDDDSSSTESEEEVRRKGRRYRGGMSDYYSSARLKNSKRSSDSDESDKESDGSESSGKRPSRSSAAREEPKKRGRKPKKQSVSSNKDEGQSRSKKMKEELNNTNGANSGGNGNGGSGQDPFRKPPLHQLKKTGESFLQDGSCFEVSAKLPKCRECRWTAQQRKYKVPNIFCRFYAFRRLRYTKSGQLAVAGFSDPVKVRWLLS